MLWISRHLTALIEEWCERGCYEQRAQHFFQLAAEKGQLGAAQLLVEHGANIHVQNCLGFTPLHGASFR
ncbi:hypothetical protein BJV77DRAFT_1002532, partial [Russula vinacea]